MIWIQKLFITELICPKFCQILFFMPLAFEFFGVFWSCFIFFFKWLFTVCFRSCLFEAGGKLTRVTDISTCYCTDAQEEHSNLPQWVSSRSTCIHYNEMLQGVDYDVNQPVSEITWIHFNFPLPDMEMLFHQLSFFALDCMDNK